MFHWLIRWWREPSIRPIQTLDDLTAAIRAGEVHPIVTRQGDVQTVDLFAETGLSDVDHKKVMLRACNCPSGICMYVHRACSDAYLKRVAADGQLIYSSETEEWTPEKLVGLYRDVTHCDECGREFVLGDEGYIAYWIVSPAELSL
jgi:hypothetical protein